MPELPEVETLRRQMNHVLVSKEIAMVEVFKPKSLMGNKDTLIGKEISSIGRIAKVLLVKFKECSLIVFIHLKMTGQLIYVHKEGRIVGGHPTPDWIRELPSKHTRVQITFTDESRLFFNDQRIFGWIKVIDTKTKIDKELSNFKGIEPLTSEFTVNNLQLVFTKTKRPVKVVLMDQSLIAGVGNIYANDALWEAKIYPLKKTSELTYDEIERLHCAIEKVIAKGIKYGGATDNTYRQLDGLGGKYQEHFLVYQKFGQKCKRCKSSIERIKVGLRGTFFCPQCQSI